MARKKHFKLLRSKEKKMIVRILETVKESGTKGGGKACMARVTEATCVSRSTVFRIKKEPKETGQLMSPKRNERGPYKPIDSFDEAVIRNKIRELYTVRKQLPTLQSLLTALKADINYPGGRDHLRLCLEKLGFSWKPTTNNRKVLTEKTNVVTQRFSFYKKKEELQQKGFTFVFVNETWVDSAYTPKRCWQSDDIQGIQAPLNRGKRLIVVHAGSRRGFIPGAKLIYKSSTNTGDYHNEMNNKNFTKWMLEKLIPNLPPRSAVVMDNASYHSTQTNKCPSSNSNKATMQEWLKSLGVEFDPKMTNKKLLELVRLHKPPTPSYAVDQLLKQHGHEVLRLPPYHPDFNPIELIWGQMKSLVGQRNLTFRLDDTLRIVNEAFDEIGEGRWQRACDHTEKVIQQMKMADNYKPDRCPTVVITLSDGSDSDSGSSTDTAGSSIDTASEDEYTMKF